MSGNVFLGLCVLVLAVFIFIGAYGIQGAIKGDTQPHPQPTPRTPAYRWLVSVPENQDTLNRMTNGVPTGTPVTATLPAGTMYNWFTSALFDTLGTKYDEGERSLVLPGCHTQVFPKHRYFYAYREDLGDLHQWQWGAFNQPNALQMVGTFQDPDHTYQVWASRDRWLCTNVGGTTVEVSP